MIPLNSRWHVLARFCAIAALLNLSTDATFTETYLIIKGNLTELEHYLLEVQVIIQSDSNESLKVFGGCTIKEINMGSAPAHMTMLPNIWHCTTS